MIPFLINNWKPVAFAALLTAILILFLRLQAETTRANEAERGRDAAVVLSNSWKLQTTIYKNKAGYLINRTKVLELDAINAKALYNSKEMAWVKKFDALRNTSQIKSASTFETAFISAEVPEKIVRIPCKDTLKAFRYELKDQWNNIQATVIDTPKFEIRDRYYGIVYLKRPKGWFWKFQWSNREAVSELTNSNKLIRIDSIAVIQVK